MNEIESIDIESIVPIKSNTKCGELYFENSIIKCVCLFCNNSFETITIFTNHLLEEHLYFRKISKNNGNNSEKKTDDNIKPNIPIINTLPKSPIAIPEEIIPEEILPEEILSEEILDELPPQQLKIIPQQLKITNVQNAPAMYNCKLCKISFLTRNTFRMHYRKYHRKCITKPFVPNICNICNRTLCSKDALRRHMGLHTGPIRPYKCRYCPHTCTLKGNLTQHEKLHSDEKNQQCGYCGKKFHIRFEKNMHERRVHTKERPYQCEICGRNFFTVTLMNNHKKRHTNTRNFVCNICDKKFYDRQLLKDHMIAHSDEKPHKCDVCMAKFGRRKALLQHIKIHNDIKQYNCLLCNKSFAQKPGLYSHMKSHAKQEKV